MKIKKITFELIIVSICFFIPTSVFATNYARNIMYESTRSLGMGGVSVSIADDHQAMFSNPAGLAENDDNYFQILGPQVNISDDYHKVNSSIDKLSSRNTNTSILTNINEIASNIGKVGYRSLNNLAYYVGKNGFSTYIYYQKNEKYVFANPASPFIHSEVNEDCMLAGSIARPFNKNYDLFRNKASGWWGSSIKFMSKKAKNKFFYIKDFPTLSKHDIKDTDKTGVTLDLDASALWQLNSPLKPTIGMMVGNILSSEFSSSLGNLYRQFAVGVSIRPLAGPDSRNEKLVLAAEYWNSEPNKSFMSKIRLGMEVKISDIFKFQFGVRSGYGTAGLTLNWKDFSLQAATYATELGKRAGDKENRRYSISAGLNF